MLRGWRGGAALSTFGSSYLVFIPKPLELAECVWIVQVGMGLDYENPSMAF